MQKEKVALEADWARVLLSAAAMAIAFGPACSSDQPSGNVCNDDTQCPAPGTRCDVAIHTCVCKNDEACDKGFFCNHAGVCQALAGCTNNADCKQENTFCDIISGQCLAGPPMQLGAACGVASHCPFGSVCTAGVCAAGCFDDGDCPLGALCLDGQCASGTGLCSSDEFCKYGERCVDTTSPAQCKADRRGPYCRGCMFRTAANPEPCDAPRNFCLVNSLEATGFRFFCGVDCSLGQACPNGYDCHGVLILTEDTCVATAQCQCDPSTIRLATATCTVSATCEPKQPDGTPDPNADFCIYAGQRDCNGGIEGGAAACVVPRSLRTGGCTCAVNEECGDGQVCVAGLCCSGEIRTDRDCVLGENRVSGFCTCATDDDCPRDSCDTSRGACAITGNPCTVGGGECGPIPCIDGACLIGQNCAPVEGLSCSILTE